MCPEFLEFILEHDGQFIDRLARPPGSLMVHRRDGRSRIELKLNTEVDVGIEMSGARDRLLRLGEC